MNTTTIYPSDGPQPWDGERRYSPKARCTNKGRLWECGETGVYNHLIEPGGFAPFYWNDVTEADA